MVEVIKGPKAAAHNLSRNLGTGSLHDDATATDLGFRGGPVRGDNHVNQFVPLALEVFGEQWFKTGHLSVDFKSPVLEGEEVQVFAEPLDEGSTQVNVWMERSDGTIACKGTAGIGDTSQSELRTKDARLCSPTDLRVCKNLTIGMDLGTYEIHLSSDDQFERYDTGQISGSIKSYRQPDIFPDVVACPSTYLELLWRGPTVEGLGAHLPDDFIGLFGGIEICNVNGPLLFDRSYKVTSQLVAVGESPKTENVWHDARAFDDDGVEIVSLRMLQRILKASSDLYSK